MRRCPVCGKPEVPEYRPFCGRRCADIDLGRWLTGAYVLPGEAAEPGAAGGTPDDPLPPPAARDGP